MFRFVKPIAISFVATFIAIFMAIFMGAAGANAANIYSEAFYQPDKGQNVLNPELNFASETGQLKNSNQELSETGPTLNFGYEVGLTNDQALRARVGYKQGQQDAGNFTGDKQGLTDVLLTYKTRRSWADSSLHAGVHLKAALEGRKESQVEAENFGTLELKSIDSNASSSGNSLTPYLGYQKIIGPQVVGAKFTQTIFGTIRKYKTETRIKNPGPTLTVTDRGEERGGGLSELKAFYERGFERWNLGVAAFYRNITKVERKAQGSNWSNHTDSLQLVGVEAYPTWRMSPNATLVGNLSYQSLLTDDPTYNSQEVDSAVLYSMSVGGRFSF